MNSTINNGICNDFTTKGWKDCVVGKNYLSLFPNDIHQTNVGLQNATCDVFQSGMMTVNFHNCYHKDRRDKNQVSHCSFSPPVHWNLKVDTVCDDKCVFGMGSVLCDISKYPMRISFMPKDVFHCTSSPFNVPKIPDYLLNCCSNKINLNRKNVFEFIEKSILAWGSWSWWRNNTARQHKWENAIEGIEDRSGQIAARRQLIERWAQYSFTQKSVISRRNRESRRVKRAKKCHKS